MVHGVTELDMTENAGMHTCMMTPITQHDCTFRNEYTWVSVRKFCFSTQEEIHF